MDTIIPAEEEIFDGARQIHDPTERTAFLNVSCRGDDDLRTRLETLLAAHDEAESFFADGASVVSASETINHLQAQSRLVADPEAARRRAAEAVGQTIGRYKLIAKIGEGGCGVVYLAEQEKPVRRQVALKIIRGGMETKSVIARFEAERQALAMMDHPNIARVFDAGETDDGLPYFVMEHVRGVRITEYCDEHRLPLPERLNLFIQVCHAIQHAHQNCIVHGDIKPSNIIVAQHDGVPVPKVIDFGISKATEARRPERHPHVTVSRLVGTPAYMSPEQVEFGGVDIDTRSDLYSLGILLHELLIGRPPIETQHFSGASLDEIRRLLRSHRNERLSVLFLSLPPDNLRATASARQTTPRRLATNLHGDLDCIVLKALEHDRRLRYDTADALAMDVHRHLHLEPVVAHPSNWFYRSSKLFRRNRAMFLASGAVALALIVGTGTSTWLFLREREARQRAVAAEHQQARLRHQAEIRESITQAALMISQERFEEGDDLVEGIRLTESTMEGAAVFRAIGEWHALHERWKQAAKRFEVLLRINHLEGADVSSLDYLELGPVLLELGDLTTYENFRREAIARFSGKQTPFADRIVKISLLSPADTLLIAQLRPLAELNERAILEAEAMGDVFTAAWRSMSMALYEYRSGRLTSAQAWCERSLDYPDNNAPRAATARTILAMAHFRLGRPEASRDQLATARQLIWNSQSRFADRGTPVNGFWFDWAFAEILLREASTLVERPRPPTSGR